MASPFTPATIPGSGGGILESLLDAKGDMIAASAADTAAKLGAGTNTRLLQADSSQTAGVGWLGAGLSPLFDNTLDSDTATFDTGAGGFAATYAHLMIVAYLRTTEAVIISTAAVTFNNDTGANYDNQTVRGRDTTASSADGQAAANWTLPIPGASAAAGVFGGALVFMPAYAQTVGEKAAYYMGGFADEAATGGDAGVKTIHWRSTVAVARIIFTAGSGSNFLTGSRLTVYGIGV